MKEDDVNIMRKVVGDSYVSRIVNSGHSLCPVRYSNPLGCVTYKKSRTDLINSIL